MHDDECHTRRRRPNRRSRANDRHGIHANSQQPPTLFAGKFDAFDLSILKLKAFLHDLPNVDEVINIRPALFRNRQHRLDIKPLVRVELVERVVR